MRVRRSQEQMKAITVVEIACRAFEQEYRMEPKVVLLPSHIFERYDAERRVLDSVLGDGCVPQSEPAPGWTSVRVVEHPGIDAIEVF